MRRRTAAALFFGGAIGLSSVGYAVAPPADALPVFRHTSAAGFTSAVCRDNGTWSATLSITATDAGKMPKATIATPQSPITGADVPFHTTFIIANAQPTYTVSVRVDWNDGVSNNLGTFTANRPDGCTVPTTQPGTTTTTTCAQSIPPRVDCGTATTPAPTTTVALVESTVVTAPEPTTPPTSDSVTSAPRSSPPAPGGPTTIVRLNLPATCFRSPCSLAEEREDAYTLRPVSGSDTHPLVLVVGVAFLLAGVALVAVRRRWVG